MGCLCVFILLPPVVNRSDGNKTAASNKYDPYIINVIKTD